MSIERTVTFSTPLNAYLSTLPFPVAVIPPALGEIFKHPVSNQQLRAALLSLGFADVHFVSDHLPNVINDLKNQAHLHKRKYSFFTACPAVDAMLVAHQNNAESLRIQVDPPAARAVNRARKSHPNAVLFFISPCSARGASLDIDHEIPLHTIFQALSEALHDASSDGWTHHPLPSPLDDPSSPVCSPKPHTQPLTPNGGHSDMDYATLDDANEILAFLKGETKVTCGSKTNKKPIVREFVGCQRGCAFGDWSPLTQAHG